MRAEPDSNPAEVKAQGSQIETMISKIEATQNLELQRVDGDGDWFGY